MNPKRGEVWLVDLGLAAKVRPVVIVSRNDPNPPRALLIYVPVTTQNRGSVYEVPLPRLAFLQQGSIANIQGLGSIPTARLERKLGELTDDVMLRIDEAIMFALNLEIYLQLDNPSENDDYAD